MYNNAGQRQGAAPALARTRHGLPVAAPFRLDLTVSALRRLPTNVVDVLTPEGHYLRAYAGSHGPIIARAEQLRADELDITIESDARDAGEHARVLALVGRTLGVDRDLTHFGRAAAEVPWLEPLARRLRGIKPPRYPTLWEAFINAVVFQQVSLHAASAIVGRLIVAFGIPLESDGTSIFLFPDAERVLDVPVEELRAVGLSASKVSTLRAAGEAILSDNLDAAMLEGLPSAEAADLLQQIKGVGPWTATVILLRGFGRLDAFPMNDSGVARNFALVAGDAQIDISHVLATLGPQKGMLYYHLLLARLEERGEIGSASVPARVM